MPLFGAHMSIAGGYYKALLTAHALRCDSVQLFTKSSNQWKAKEFVEEDVQTFRKTLQQTKLKLPTAHNSYLINLASPDNFLYRRSIDAFIVEMERAERLGLRYLVTHPGSPLDSGEEAGIQRIVKALDKIHERCPGFKVQILLETTAGQGSCLGHRFEHLAEMLSRVNEPGRLGICFDTCHVFAAGYPLSPPEQYDSTMQTFQRLIGLKHLKVFHVNDSLKPLGSRVDRHTHIGKGFLGLEPFNLLVNDARFRKCPMLLETPKEDGENKNMDEVNLGTLRGLAKESHVSPATVSSPSVFEK